MDFGFDVSGAVSGVSQMNEGMSGKLTIIMSILVLGIVGRQLFVAFGSNLKLSNPLANMSGVGVLLVGVGVLVGGLFVAGKGQSALIQVQRNIVDPFVVGVLERDSCEIASGAYCVVVFEEDREIIVNWHDKRVDMYAIANPRTEILWKTQRPVARTERLAAAEG